SREVGEIDPGRIDPAALLDDFGERVERARIELDSARPLADFPASDPRKAMFAALRSLRAETFIATDPGITGVLALAEHGCDVKMHMGGAVPIAAGWSRARPTGLAIAVVGDTNLPHSEWLGLLYAIYHGVAVLGAVADDGAREMSQRIGTPRLAPERARASLEAAGTPCTVATASNSLEDPDDPWVEVLREAAGRRGPRVVWLSLP